MDNTGTYWIERLRKKWVLQVVLLNLCLTLCLSWLLYTIIAAIIVLQWWYLLPLLLVTGVVVFFINVEWKLKNKDVAVYLNRNVAAVEESAGLLLQPLDSLGFLEQLQVERIAAVAEQAQIKNPLKRRSQTIIILCLVALVCSAFLLNQNFRRSQSPGNLPAAAAINKLPEKKLPQIKSMRLSITPPGYTKRAARQQSRFNFVAEENALAQWSITTTQPVKQLQLIVNAAATIDLKPTNPEKTAWGVSRRITRPGFYQLKINQQLSELYRIEMVKDKAPVISIQSPASGTLIKSGQPKKTVLQVAVNDDYGIRKAAIFATIASGSGEAVKFKEQQLGFAGFTPGRAQNKLQQPLDLAKMGMQPGDELYFYIEASDDAGQRSRSDVVIVTLEDTAQLMSMDGLVMGLDLKPELFRSQRQIIIETEQLLKDKPRISVEEFNNKSNSLGIDQQLLRLRYGKFLGEETNTEIGEGHDEHDGEAGHENKFGDPSSIMDQFSHKHDIAEDATFFDPETKKQLKATLAEMWKSEAKLRLHLPAEALPFEYNALRLLKDLQQKSRVYVGKTSSKIPPLKPAEKRLTGELDKIGQPVYRATTQPPNTNLVELRKALGALEQIKYRGTSAEIMPLLLPAGEALSLAAANEPAKYLAGLEAYKKIASKQFKPSDILKMQRSLQALLQHPARLPLQAPGTPASTLSEQYFKNLKNGSR